MVSKYPSLPHWSWIDLEAALERFGNDPTHSLARAHLFQGLKADAEQMSPTQLLHEVLAIAALLGAPAGGTPLLPEASSLAFS